MHSLEAACNEAQNLITKVELYGLAGLANNSKSNQTGIAAIPGPSWSTNPYNQSIVETPRKPRVYNIHQKLRDLYLEERRNADLYSDVPLPLRKNLKRGSKLLDKLVRRDNLNTLIVNLYPGNKGYSLSLRLQGKVPAVLGNQAGRSQGSEPVVETMRWPYNDEELLRCIDREEIPAHLVDLLEENHSDLFYQGCIIAEIRDYRLTFPLFTFETHHVLLKPTTQSIINDVNVISSLQDFSAEERLSLESQIVLATAPPLCLDPNPAIGIMLNNLNHKRFRFSTALLRRTARKFSQVTVNRKRKLDQFTNHNTLQLYDFITRRKAKLRAANQGKQVKKTSDEPVSGPPPVPSEDLTLIQPPSVEPDVFKYAKQIEKTKETTDCSVHLIEEYILETERAQGRIYRIKLTILQRHSNSEYLGELYVDRDYKEGERSGASCRFVLGTRVHANRYIQQFTEIFTEEGRKSVRITHVIPGQQQRVSYTPGMRERNSAYGLSKQDRIKFGPNILGITQGKQLASIMSTAQNSISSQSIHMQPMLSNSQHILPPSHIDMSPSGVINFGLNSQTMQKLHGQLNSSTNVSTHNPSPNSAIQINSVSHLTNLLTNSNVAAPPNVNIHQIQQGQSVIGVGNQATASMTQGRSIGQHVVNVQNIGLNSQNISNSTIQSLLTSALSSNTLGEDSITNMQNGPISSGSCPTQNALNNSLNVTVHHPPSQSQVPSAKASRSPLATNPAISALVTSLMNSAQQFQVQQAAQQAANNATNSSVQPNSVPFTPTSSSNTSQNTTILSLLNATTPLSMSPNSNNTNTSPGITTTTTNSGNIVSTPNMNLNQQNQKVLSRKTITNLLNSRLLNQNLNTSVNNRVSNPALVVNNSNPQPLRVTLSSLNQLMGQAGQNSGSQSQQILNVGNNSSSSTGFTISSQGSITLPTQPSNMTTQSFTSNSQTFTITTQNTQNQTYSLTAPSMANLTQAQNHTFTLSSNTGSLCSQSFTLSPANTNTLSNTGFSISPAGADNDFSSQSTHNSGSQTFTVLQPNQTLGNQSFTISTPVVTVGSQAFAVTNAQASIGNQAFTITSGSVPCSNKTYQISSPGTTNHTFTISTPVVTVANHFLNSQSPPNQNFAGHVPSQKFVLNSPATQTSSNNVFTASTVPSQVFTVNIPPPVSSHNTNFNTNFPSSNQSAQAKTQSSVLINKNQAFSINASNQNFASLISNNPNYNNVKNSEVLLGSANGNNNGSNTGGSGSSSGSGSGSSSNSSDNSGSNLNKMTGSGVCLSNNASSGVISRNSAGRISGCQRKLSSASQMASNSELNKLLSERSDTILLTESNTLFNDKGETVLSEKLVNEKKSLNENSKLSQALSGNVDGGTNSSGNASSHGLSSNLGLSMPGLSALLAGTPSADNPIPGASNSSSLLERLASSTPNVAFASPPLPNTPQSPNISGLSPNPSLNFQNSTYPPSSNTSSLSCNSTLSTVAGSSVPNYSSSSPKSQVQFQSPSPNSKDILGISSPMSSPPGSGPVSLNLQGLNLQSIPGLQNVQVSIPGLAVPISLSLNVSGQPGNSQGVIMTSLAVAPTRNTNTTTSTMVLTNTGNPPSSGNILSLPLSSVAPLMPQGTKTGNQRSTSASATQGNPQSIQLVSSLQRPGRPSTNQLQGSKNMQSISSRGITTPKSSLKSGNSQISGSVNAAGLGNQVLTLTAQQQLQLALQKQAQIQQCYSQQNQKRPVSPPSSVTNKHRRRSNTADSNK